MDSYLINWPPGSESLQLIKTRRFQKIIYLTTLLRHRCGYIFIPQLSALDWHVYNWRISSFLTSQFPRFSYPNPLVDLLTTFTGIITNTNKVRSLRSPQHIFFYVYKNEQVGSLSVINWPSWSGSVIPEYRSADPEEIYLRIHNTAENKSITRDSF